MIYKFDSFKPITSDAVSFFIINQTELIECTDHILYIATTFPEKRKKLEEKLKRYPTEYEWYSILKGENHIRGYISNTYKEFGIDIMFQENIITNDTIENISLIHDAYKSVFDIEKYFFDWQLGFKFSQSFPEFITSIKESKYYRNIWKSTTSM